MNAAQWTKRLALLGLVAGLTAASSGCAGRAVNTCLTVNSGPALNTFDGQPHVVVLYLFPLENEQGFRQADSRDLLDDPNRISGLAGGRFQFVVPPSEEIKWKEAMPPSTRTLGLLADYYRGPNDPPGTVKAVVRASCKWFRKPKVVLTPSNLLVRSGGETTTSSGIGWRQPTRDLPNAPRAPNTPEVPSTPKAPSTPSLPDAPRAPQAPTTPGW